MIIHENDAVYTGEDVKGKRHGFGTLVWPDDTRYEGYGVMEYPDGSRYEGNWHADKRCGHGKLTDPDGTVFEGEFANDLPLQHVESV